MKINRWKWVCVPLLFSGVIGCENNTQNGALIGGLGGAAVGGGIGSMSHGRAGEGALIGAAVGAIGGALVGNQMDKNSEKSDREYARTTETRSYKSDYAASSVSKQDVINWSNRGVRDDIIIDRVERSGNTFKLTAADENQLRDEGVSECVIQSMRATSRR